ncbi:L,D-transpeptidase family protein [Kitasatospora sp. NPDC101176]|uniref:L,D-transpeptidase family protein n=1 Tax=Kitasatospora sp. NPDC101176 TaxID=3364099 RepID=UPI00380B9CC9
MSGSHRATAYPSYEPMPEPVYEAPQPSHQDYGAYQQPVQQGHGDYRPNPQDGYFEAYDQPFRPHPAGHAAPAGTAQQYAYGAGPGYGQQSGYEAAYEAGYEAPYGAGYDPEPVYLSEPFAGTEPVHPAESFPAPESAPPADLSLGPVSVPLAAEAPAGSRAAARGRRRKAKQKRHGKAVMAGTALLVAAAAGWYTVGQEGAKPGVTAADGPGPEGVSTPDQPSPGVAAAQPAAAQAAADRQNTDPAAARSQARADASVAAIPGLGASFTAKIPAETTQVVVASGQDKGTDKNSVTLWTRTPEGRWLAGETWQGHNGKNGWTTDHSEGDLRSPIGVFSLTDAGGRNADPGSKLPYDKDPSFVVSGTGFFGDQLAGSFDYVVAINYNRVPGNSPLDPRRPMGAKKGGGIWIHVDHDGPTHGCVSIPEDKMAELIRTLDPAAHPVIVMGDATSLAA